MRSVSDSLQKAIQASHLDPDACVLRHVTRTSRLIVAAFDTAFSPVGLSGHQFNLLMTLARRGPLNVGSLAAAVGMHPSTTPRLIAPLVRDRLILTRAGADRRERVIGITRKGRSRLLQAFPHWIDVQTRVVGQLGERRWSSAMAALRNIRGSLQQSPGSY
jgi:DNA-binding MarR family transcriptional regulator